MIVLFSVFFSVMARLFPPLSPTASADEITDFLVQHKIWIRFGIAGSLLAVVVAFPFLAAICLRIRRVEGRWGMLAVTQLLAAAVFVPAFIFAFIILAAAAFRPDQRPPEITLALDDLFWLWFVGIAGTIIVQNLTLAVAAFVDTTEPRTFPRWYGYLNLWVATLSLPGGMTVVFNDGPLAWNGVFSFYIPGAALLIWLFASTFVIAGSVKAQQAAEAHLVAA
ncbi:hypothetical protein CQY20_31025 [Mycolicibacterium agri]|nr:hypothetical protein [Mycolicibacterium agri]PEG33395.1 hypothetical protein CQY20_31025 [Mycolicibacterium agri]